MGLCGDRENGDGLFVVGWVCWLCLLCCVY